MEFGLITKFKPDPTRPEIKYTANILKQNKSG